VELAIHSVAEYADRPEDVVAGLATLPAVQLLDEHGAQDEHRDQARHDDP
jgi:hypothetical protein